MATAALTCLPAAEAPAAAIPINVRGRGWIEAEVLRCEEGRLWLALPGRSGEFAVAVSDVSWAAFPAPPDLGTLEHAARAGNEGAFRRLRETFQATRTMMAVPGSHAPRIGLALVARLGEVDPAEQDAILEILAREAWDPHVRTFAALRLARLRLEQNRPSDAAGICRSVLASSTTARNEAEAWLILGRAGEELGEPENALGAYLHPIALHARDPAILQSALEGAERASRALGRAEAAAIYAEELRLLAEREAAAAEVTESERALTATEGEDVR